MGIETSYRVEDGFEAKTTSRNFTLRVIYFMLSIILYNLWYYADNPFRIIKLYVCYKSYELINGLIFFL